MKRRLVGAVVAVGAVASVMVQALATTGEPPANAYGRYANFQLLTAGEDVPFASGPWAGFVQDRRGVTHTLAGSSKGLEYLTRAPGSARWRRSLVPGDGSGADLALSPSGNRLYLAVSACRPWVTAMRPTAATFHPVAEIDPLIPRCEPEGDSDNNYEMRGLAGLPHHRVAVLLNHEGNGSEGADGLYVFTGRPGGHWHHTRLGGSVSYDEMVQITRDADTGALYVAGGNLRVYVKEPGHPWSADTNVPLAPQMQVTSLAAMNGRAWVALQNSSRGPDENKPAAPQDGVFIALRHRDGTWAQPNRLTGTESNPLKSGADSNSLELRLSVDSQHHVLQALYTVADYFNQTTSSGLYYAHHKYGTWSKPEQITHWWHDTALHIASTTTGGYTFDFQRNS